jgi:3-phenylpropionate/trans-cinnamate dioxygenase ferredoxin reductase component
VVTERGIIIVGSGPAGGAAAESYRKHDAATPVRILSADRGFPYARPPLSKEFLRGQTDDVALHPAKWFDDRAIELLSDATVDHLDRAERAAYVGGSAAARNRDDRSTPSRCPS